MQGVWMYKVGEGGAGAGAGAWASPLPIEGTQPPPHFASGLVFDGDRHLFAYGGRIHPKGKDEELWTGLWKMDIGALVGDCGGGGSGH